MKINSTLLVFLIAVFSLAFLSYFELNMLGKVINPLGEDSSQNNLIETTKAEAIELISQSEQIVREMEDNGFGVNYVNDLLIEEKKAFEQARYAEILRNGSLNENETTEARIALRLVNWKLLNYNLVTDYFNKIKQARDKAVDLNDLISVLNTRVQDYSSSGVIFSPEDLTQLEEAGRALKEERYSDADNLINQARDSIESSRIETSRMSILTNNTIDFIKENGVYFLGGILIIIIITIFTLRRLRKRRILNRIIKLTAEEKAIKELEKRTQIERYKENKISGLVYNIRMKKYKERLDKVKQELPILKNNLNNKKDKFK